MKGFFNRVLHVDLSTGASSYEDLGDEVLAQTLGGKGLAAHLLSRTPAGIDPLAPPARFIVATGIHRAPTEDEYRQIFGDHYDTYRDRIHAHDARTDEMVHLGTSKNGTEMEVNRIRSTGEAKHLPPHSI